LAAASGCACVFSRSLSMIGELRGALRRSVEANAGPPLHRRSAGEHIGPGAGRCCSVGAVGERPRRDGRVEARMSDVLINSPFCCAVPCAGGSFGSRVLAGIRRAARGRAPRDVARPSRGRVSACTIWPPGAIRDRRGRWCASGEFRREGRGGTGQSNEGWCDLPRVARGVVASPDRYG